MSGGREAARLVFAYLHAMNRTIQLLRSLIREEIGHNFKTKDNDPYQYYETTQDVGVEIYPSHNGYTAKITVPEDESLSSHERSFPTEAECTHFARQYVEYVRKVLDQRNV